MDNLTLGVKKMNDIHYNTPTHAMLQWGSVTFQQKSFKDYLDRIESDIWDLDESPENYIMEDVAHIIQHAREAREYLFHDSLLGITPEDCEWNEIREAYECLDNLVFMATAMSQLIRPKIPSFADQYLSQLYETLDEINESFYDQSPLRWVQFNELRQNKLQSIDPQKRFQFPWYELMANEPSDLLALLAVHYHQLNDQTSLPDTLTANLSLYLYEMQRDQTLLNFLQMDNVINQAIFKTFDKHWAFRLWHAAKFVGYSRIISEKIENIGLEKVREKIFKYQSNNPQNKLVLEMADYCFGSGYSNAARVKKLLSCESKVSSLKLDTDSDSPVCSHAAAISLKNLENGHVMPEDVAKSLLDFWFDQMEWAVNKAKAPVSDLISRIKDFIGKISSSYIPELAPALAHACNTNVQWQHRGEASEGDVSKDIFNIKGIIFAEAHKAEDVIILNNNEDIIDLHSNIHDSFDMLSSEKLNYYYQAIYFQDNQWNSTKEKRIRTTPIQISDLNIMTAFILLVDNQKRALKESTKIMIDMLTNSSDKKMQLKPTTVILFVNVNNETT